jgi:hypothetical protein
MAFWNLGALYRDCGWHMGQVRLGRVVCKNNEAHPKAASRQIFFGRAYEVIQIHEIESQILLCNAIIPLPTPTPVIEHLGCVRQSYIVPASLSPLYFTSSHPSPLTHPVQNQPHSALI